MVNSCHRKAGTPLKQDIHGDLLTNFNKWPLLYSKVFFYHFFPQYKNFRHLFYSHLMLFRYGFWENLPCFRSCF